MLPRSHTREPRDLVTGLGYDGKGKGKGIINRGKRPKSRTRFEKAPGSGGSSLQGNHSSASSPRGSLSGSWKEADESMVASQAARDRKPASDAAAAGVD